MIAFETFRSISGAQIVSSPGEMIPHEFTGVSIDSRSINEGDVFCALKGDRADGHDFIIDAFNNGAAGAIVQSNSIHKVKHRIEGVHTGRQFRCLFFVPDTLKALQELAHLHRRRYTATVIGITGTNGKTSVKDMIFLVLSQKYTVLKTPGNYNNQIGLPLTLLSMDERHEIAVIEMGANHSGEIADLCRIAEPGVGIITNIGRGHLEYFGSLEGVAREKAEILQSLSSPGEGFLNGDDPYLEPYRNLSPNIKTFGMNAGNTVTGTVTSRTPDGCAALQAGTNSPIQMNVPGTGQAYNGLAAYAIGLLYGLSHESIKTGLESYTGSSNRGVWLNWKGMRIYNDSYNANPDSLQNALDIMKEVPLEPKFRRIAVLGDMLELGERSIDEHRKMGEAVFRAGCDIVYTYGNYSKELSDEARSKGVPESRHFTDKQEIADALKQDRTGDIMILKGSRGMAMEEILKYLGMPEGQ